MNRLLARLLPVALFAIAGCGQNVGSTPEETWKLSTQNTQEIAKILQSVKDDATADAALPKLESAVERHNPLAKKMHSYTLPMDEWGKVVKDNVGETIKGSFELGGAAIKAGINAPSRAEKIQTVLKKMEKPKKGPAK